MITYLLIVLAALFNSVMDKTKDTIQYNSSLFGKLGWNPKFWNDQVSEHIFILGTKYKPNAWHISKSCMLTSLFLAIIYYKPFIPIVDFICMGAVWVMPFNLFYNHILKFNK